MSGHPKFKIREATLTDILPIAVLHVDAFNETHGGDPLRNPSYDTRIWQWRQLFYNDDKSWFCFVIEKDDGHLVGFAKGQPYSHPDQPVYEGELNKIYILRQYHRLGLGRQLIQKVAQEFLKRGIHSMLLFGDAGNPSNGFYEKMGAERLYAKNGDFHGGYGWRNVESLNC